MSMNLDARARAILQEMGVKVWQPTASALRAIPRVDASPTLQAGIHAARQNDQPQAASSARSTPVLTRPRPEPPLELRVINASEPSQRRYCLQQTPEVASFDCLLVGEPCTGDALVLLQNMIRAMKWFNPQRVATAQMVQSAQNLDHSSDNPELLDQLALLQPPLTIALGPHAANAVLAKQQSGNPRPFGQLRGVVHETDLGKVIVTYHPQQLLRQLPFKAKAWADLKLSSAL